MRPEVLRIATVIPDVLHDSNILACQANMKLILFPSLEMHVM